MAKEIIWSPRATKSFHRVIEYLKVKWTDKEVERFIIRTEKTLKLLSQGNIIFRTSEKKDFHEVLVTKHNLLLYRIRKNEVQLMVFFDTRQHPKKKQF